MSRIAFEFVSSPQMLIHNTLSSMPMHSYSDVNLLSQAAVRLLVLDSGTEGTLLTSTCLCRTTLSKWWKGSLQGQCDCQGTQTLALRHLPLITNTRTVVCLQHKLPAKTTCHCVCLFQMLQFSKQLMLHCFFLCQCSQYCVCYRWVKQENEISKNPQGTALGPKLDLGFKDGQTITLNIGVKTKHNWTRSFL